MDTVKKEKFFLKSNFYIKLFLIYFFFYFFFEILIFISPVEVQVSKTVYHIYYYNFLLIIPLFFFSIFFDLSVPFKRIDYLLKINTANKLKYIITFVLLGIFFTVVSKYFLYSDYINELRNSETEIFSGECVIHKIRYIWSTQNFTNAYYEFLYSILSPIGVVLINFNILLLIYIYANIYEIKRSKIFFLIILFLFSIVIYFISNFKSNVIINIIIFTLSLFIINFFFLKKKKLFKLTFFLISLLLTLLYISFYSKNSCSIKSRTYTFAEEIELRKVYTNKINDSEYIFDYKLAWTPFTIKEDVIGNGINSIIYKIRKKLSSDDKVFFSLNKIILYGLASKNNGYYLIHNQLIENDKKKLPRYIFFKRFYNSIVYDFYSLKYNEVEKFPSQFYKKALGGFSVSSLLIYDFKFFGLLIFFIIIFFLFYFISKLYSYLNKNLTDILLFVYLLLVITTFVGGELFFIYETLNFRFIFFNIIVFFLYCLIVEFIRKNKR